MEHLKLTRNQKNDLLLTARLTIQQKLFNKTDREFPSLEDSIFDSKLGLFVTLKIDGNLRGCIGYLQFDKPIRILVKEMAIQAAFHDPRFSPLTKNEFNLIKLEISILYPPIPVNNINEIVIGRDGIIVERGFNRGLLLPQVAIEYNWDLITFLNHTCRKAGLEYYCWENKAKVYRFEADYFGEVDL